MASLLLIQRVFRIWKMDFAFRTFPKVKESCLSKNCALQQNIIFVSWQAPRLVMGTTAKVICFILMKVSTIICIKYQRYILSVLEWYISWSVIPYKRGKHVCRSSGMCASYTFLNLVSKNREIKKSDFYLIDNNYSACINLSNVSILRCMGRSVGRCTQPQLKSIKIYMFNCLYFKISEVQIWLPLPLVHYCYFFSVFKQFDWLIG